MQKFELTPCWILRSGMAPDLTGTKHGVDGASELAGGGDARDAPVDALLELDVILRQPAVGSAAYVNGHGLDERMAEPTVGTGGYGSVTNGHPGPGRARCEAGVADQVSRGPEALDGQHLGGDEKAAIGSDAGNRLKKAHGGDLLAHVADAAVQTLPEALEPVGDALVGSDEALLLGTEEGPGSGMDPGAARARKEPTTG